jgi:hypothetical protein
MAGITVEYADGNEEQVVIHGPLAHRCNRQSGARANFANYSQT